LKLSTTVGGHLAFRDHTVSSPLLDKREVRIRRMFDQIARSYDFLNHLSESEHRQELARDRTARLVPPGPGGARPILDLCTGTGDLALAYDRDARAPCPSSAPTSRARCSCSR
jgi:demethylmenaquinone methyltransferase/2-methoxy-6-polyprenyl-1,4-benzoquinol methylase